jgi:hypothetical protein
VDELAIARGDQRATGSFGEGRFEDPLNRRVGRITAAEACRVLMTIPASGERDRSDQRQADGARAEPRVPRSIG